MKYLKPFLEDYDYDAIDNKDMINIIQDIKDMGFEITIHIKYVSNKDIDTINFKTTQLLASKFEDSHKCYYLTIKKSLTDDVEGKGVDTLSDFFYELQTAFSRLSEAGKIVYSLAINTSKYRPKYTYCDIKLIVISKEKIEGEGNDKKLFDALTAAGYKVAYSDRAKDKLIVNDLFPALVQPPGLGRGGYYYGTDSVKKKEHDDALRLWNNMQKERRTEIKNKWEEIKKVCRKAKVNVRYGGYTNGLNGLTLFLAGNKASKVDLNIDEN